MIVTLVVGDWSNDGHGQTSTLQIESNFNSRKIEKAYQKGTKLVGVDLDEDVACDYEEPYMSRTQLEAFEKAGITTKEWAGVESDMLFDDDDVDRITMNKDTYVRLYCLIVKLGDPKFEFSFIPYNQVESVNVGGYGLFYG